MRDGGLVISVAHGRTPVVYLHGELDLAARDEVTRVLGDVTGSPVVVDLEHLEFTDWTGISILIGERRRLGRRGATLVVRHLPAQARRVLEVTGTVDLLGAAGPDR